MPNRGAGAHVRPDVLRGVAWMAAAMSFIGIVDAMAKWLGQTLHGLQVTWLYFATMLAMLVVYLAGRRVPARALLFTHRRRWQLARGACLTGSLSCLFVALQHMPLAEATTISFTSPLFVVALAGPLLGEHVRWQRWAAVLVGMGGAALVVRPGGELFRAAAWLPFIGAAFFALFTIITRKLEGEQPHTTLFHTFGVGTVVLGLSLPWIWQWPSGHEWVVIAGTGILGVFAHVSIVRSLSLVDASVVAPLNYVRLVWAIGLGVALFAQWPDGLALVGAAVIVLSGLYVVMGAARGR